MKKTGTPFILPLSVLVLGLAGCASIGRELPRDDHRVSPGVAAARESGMSASPKPVVLDENSTLDDFLAYAALHNAELEAAYYRWMAAVEKISRVRSLPDPRLSYAYYIENVETRVGPQRHNVNLSQTFPWFGKRRLEGDIAFEESRALRERFHALERRVLFSVKRAYFDCYYVTRAVAVAGENLRLLEDFESLVRSRYTTGKASYTDLIKLQVEIGKLEERILSLKDLKKPIRAELNAALNRPPDAPLPELVTLPEDTELPPEDVLFARLSRSNPGLRELGILADREAKSVELARKSFYPDITLGLNYIETGPSSISGIPGNGKDAVLGMISINIPLWREKYRSAVRESEIRRKSIVKAKAARGNDLAASLKRALFDYRDAERRIDLYSETLIPKTNEALAVLLNEYEIGKASFLDVVDVQRTLLELELALERARSDRAKYRAGVEFIAGADAEAER